MTAPTRKPNNFAMVTASNGLNVKPINAYKLSIKALRRLMGELTKIHMDDIIFINTRTGKFWTLNQNGNWS